MLTPSLRVQGGESGEAPGSVQETQGIPASASRERRDRNDHNGAPWFERAAKLRDGAKPVTGAL